MTPPTPDATALAQALEELDKLAPSEHLQRYVNSSEWPTGRSFSSVANELVGWWMRVRAAAARLRAPARREEPKELTAKWNSVPMMSDADWLRVKAFAEEAHDDEFPDHSIMDAPPYCSWHMAISRFLHEQPAALARDAAATLTPFTVKNETDNCDVIIENDGQHLTVRVVPLPPAPAPEVVKSTEPMDVDCAQTAPNHADAD